MESFELEDLTLWLIRDADEAEMWIDRWAVSYPVVQMSEASANGSTEAWQSALQTAFERIQGRHIAVVAHGAGAAAFLAWLYRADILTQKKLAGIILVSPRPDIFPTMRNTLSNASAVLAVPHWWCPNTAACRTVGRKNRRICGTPACWFPRIRAV